MTALTASERKGSKMTLSKKSGKTPESTADRAYGKRGANMAAAAKMQAIRLIKLHETRIILGLGVSVKSAPDIPFDREIAPKAKTKKTASRQATIV